VSHLKLDLHVAGPAHLVTAPAVYCSYICTLPGGKGGRISVQAHEKVRLNSLPASDPQRAVLTEDSQSICTCLMMLILSQLVRHNGLSGTVDHEVAHMCPTMAFGDIP
jgi:hypothetical protein